MRANASRIARLRTLLGGIAFVILILAAMCPTVRADAPAQPDVIIVGAGQAGLITAYELEQRGISTHILEAGTMFGGRVATARYGDNLIAEYGMHEMWERDPICDYAKKFNIPLSDPEEPYSSVVMDGKLYPYVQEDADAYFATLFNKDERAAYDRWLNDCEAAYDESHANGLSAKMKPLQDMSFAKWIASYNLPPRVSEFIRLALECEIAIDWDEISALYGVTQMRVFIHGSEKCRHSLTGNYALIDALVKAIRGPKTLGARVVRISRTKGPDGSPRCTVSYMKESVMHTLTAPRVVVAVPYHVLHAIQLEPTLTPTQWKAVNTLDAGRYLVVHFIIDTAANKLFKVGGRLPFPVLTRGPLGVVYGTLEEPPATQKEQVFTLLVHGDPAAPYLTPQDTVRARLLAEMEKIWPGFGSYVHSTHFYNYHPAATPAWPVGRSQFDDLSMSLRDENLGLYLVGDYIYSSHAEGAVMSARAVAGRIASEMKR